MTKTIQQTKQNYQMLRQLNVKNLFTYSPIHLFTLRKTGFTLAEGATHVVISDNIRRCAFTLAEVLITLAIIGVVAALTIPTLVQKYQEKQTVTRVLKAYNTLANAIKMAEIENGPITTWFYPNPDHNVGIMKKDATNIFNNIKPYLRISKDCGFEPDCITKGYIKKIDGSNYRDYDSNVNEYRFITSDGMAIWIYSYTGNDAMGESIYGNIKVDINGFAGDYTFGKDVFTFDITNEGLIPSGHPNAAPSQSFDYNCIQNTGAGCTAWVIYNKNMDYLHCPDELSWDGKHSCKD